MKNTETTTTRSINVSMLTLSLHKEFRAATGCTEYPDDIAIELEHCMYVACMCEERSNQYGRMMETIGIHIARATDEAKREALRTILQQMTGESEHADMYIVRAQDSDTEETYEYEYGNILHALEQYRQERTAQLVAYAFTTRAERLIMSK